MRINSWIFFNVIFLSVQFWNSHFLLTLSISLSYSWKLRVFLSTLEGVWHTWSFGATRKRKRRKAQEDIGINNYDVFFLQVLRSIYVFFTSFGMHGICMWFVDCDLSWAWRVVGIDSGLPSFSISLIAMVIMDFFSLFCFGWFSCFLSLG